MENIDEIFKSDLREKKMKNEDNNDLNLCIKKINIGLYSGFDFESVIDIKCKPDNENNKEKKEEENIELNNDNDNININEEKKK